MCGIMGYVGPQQAAPILLDGLRRLEYRGYDSAGVAVQSENNLLERVRKVGKVAEELGFYWYEDPLDEEDMLNYPKLRQQLSIPLMATEYSPGGLYSYAPWLVMQATDYLRGDVAVKAGITGILKGAHLAEAFKMNYEIHHGGNSLNNVANLHVAMAIPNTEFFEVLGQNSRIHPKSRWYLHRQALQ